MKKLFIFAIFAVVLLLASCSNDDSTTDTVDKTDESRTAAPTQEFPVYDDGKSWGSLIM